MAKDFEPATQLPWTAATVLELGRDAIQKNAEELKAVQQDIDFVIRATGSFHRLVAALDAVPHHYKCATWDEFDCDCYRKEVEETLAVARGEWTKPSG